MRLTGDTDKLYPPPKCDVLGRPIVREIKKSAGLDFDPLVAWMLWEFLFSDNWDHPRIKDRKMFRSMGYSDNRITSARKEALKHWPYIRLSLNFQEKIEGDCHNQYISYLKEIQKLKESEAIMLKKFERLLGLYLSLISEIS